MGCISTQTGRNHYPSFCPSQLEANLCSSNFYLRVFFPFSHDFSSKTAKRLIDLDAAKDLTGEPEATESTNGTSSKEHTERNKEHVTKVQHVRDEDLAGLQTAEPKDRIHEHVNGGTAGGEEGEPPPTMIFGTELVVHEEDGDLGAGEEEDDVHDEGEAEDVVVLVHPKGGHDEEQLNVGGGEGDHAGKGDGKVGIEKEAGVGNGTGNGRGDGGVVDGLLLVAKVGTEEHKGNGNAAPHGGNDKNVEEGYGADGMLEGQNNIEEDEQSEARGGEGGGREQGAGLPGTAAEGLVQAAGGVAGDDATEHVQDEGGDHERTTTGGVDEAHGTQHNGEETGDAELKARTDKDAVHHGGILGRAEDVGMDKLPTGLVDVLILLLVGQGGHGIVPGDITSEVADEDGNDEKTEEEDDQNRVGDGIPMDLRGDEVVLRQVDIPPGGPGHVGLVPDDVVGVHDLLVLLNDLVGRDVVAGHVRSVIAGGQRLGVALGRLSVPVKVAEEVVSDGHGLDGKSDDAVTLLGGVGGLVVVNVDVDVVVQVGILGITGPGIDETDGESTGVVLLLLSGLGKANCGRGDVVNNPVVVITIADVHAKIPGLDLGQLNLTQDLAVGLLLHVDGVRRVLDLVAREELTEVLGGHLGPALGNAEGQTVVILGQLGVDGGHGIDLHGHLVALLEGEGLDAGHVKCLGGRKEHGQESDRQHAQHFGGGRSGHI